MGASPERGKDEVMDHTPSTRGRASLAQIERGWDVYAADGEKVGDVSEIRGDYLIVSKGWLFSTERYIPASAIVRVEHDRVYLDVTKDDMDNQGWDRMPEDIDTYHEERTAAAPARGTAGQADREQETLQLREEELRATKRPVEAGEVEIRKEVVTEQQTIEVPVTREEAVIERRPVSPTEAGRVDAGEIGEDETIRVPLREEQVTVEKTPVVTEEVEIGKRTVQETQQVSDTVRREEAVVEHEDDVPVRQRKRGVSDADKNQRKGPRR
jgi:uncharacterized protein (TIGR02271 family)